MGNIRLTFAIPNYNGRELLEEYLPSAVAEAARTQGEAEVLVVDDASTDDSVAHLRSLAPAVRAVVLESNLGFVGAANTCVRSAAGEYVFLLNSDMRVEPGCAEKLLAVLEAADDVFAVSPRILTEGDPSVDEAPCYPFFKRGMLYFGYPGKDPGWEAPAEPTEIGRRAAFERLGGFDERYRPYYWEDSDLGWRAWKAGLRNVYVPGAVCLHRGGASINQSAASAVRTRNQYLFQWKNVTQLGMRLRHWLWLPRMVLHYLIRLKRPGLTGLLGALVSRHIVDFLVPRWRGAAALSDGEIVKRFSGSRRRHLSQSHGR